MSNTSLLRQRVRTFVAEQVLPFENQLAMMDAGAESRLEQLTAAARQAELWGLLFPVEYGGQIERLSDYVDIGFEEGRSEFASTLFGGLATVDARMLSRYGNETIKSRFLLPLSQGRLTSAYGMTEPDQPGSVPDTLSCQARQDAGGWRINGSKWYICNATKADYITVLAVTDPSARLQQRLTMFVVPIASEGCIMERSLSVFGRQLGQGQFRFDDVLVADEYRLGEPGSGFEIMQSRVALGRILRSIHWLGAADRCLELMQQRIHSPKGQAARLADKQLIRQRVYDVYAAITSTRLIIRQVASDYDLQPLDWSLLNLAKISAARAVSCAADHAIQVFGAAGVGDDTPLAGIYQMARSARILDGAEDALINTIGKGLIAAEVPSDTAATS